jgi:hypothetical protein
MSDDLQIAKQQRLGNNDLQEQSNDEERTGCSQQYLKKMTKI